MSGTNLICIFLGLAFLLVFSSCQNGPKLEGFCVHPAVMGGNPFPIPGDAYFTTYGALVIPTPQSLVTLTGAACIIGKANK